MNFSDQRQVDALRTAIGEHEANTRALWNITDCSMWAIVMRSWAFHEQCRLRDVARAELIRLEKAEPPCSG